MVKIQKHFQRRTSQSGSSLIEAAIIFPVFLLLLFGFIQYALIFSNEIALKNAVAVGARSVSILGKNPSLLAIADTVEKAVPTFDLNNLNVTPSISIDADSGRRIVAINAEYQMPLFFPGVVPGNIDGHKNIRANAVVPEPIV